MTYPNGLPVTETPEELTFQRYPETQGAYKAGCAAQARHWQEEIPPELRGVVNRVRALACRPGAERRAPEDILGQVFGEVRDLSLDEWVAR